MEKLFSSSNTVELYLLKSLLESEGIICFIKNEYPPAAGELPPVSAMPELWVMDNRQDGHAMKLLQENSLLSQTSLPWKCPRCNEQLEGQFTTCWHCGKDRTNVT